MNRFFSVERQICFSTPKRLTDVIPWHIHIPFAFYLVQRLRPQMIVELGVHRGDSYCALCQAVDELGLSTACYGVDSWKGDEHAGLYSEEIHKEFTAYHNPLYGRFSKLLKMDFNDALHYFSDKSIDLLHIDGSHFYSSAGHDFFSWLPKMRDDGLIMLHDIYVREREFGVWKLWEELKGTYQTFELSHDFGLGIVCVGEIPPSIKPLFLSVGAERENISRFFYSLGQKNLVAPRDEKIHFINNVLKAKEAELKDVYTQFHTQKKDLLEKDAEIIAKETEIQAKVQEVEVKKAELRAVKETIFYKIGGACYRSFDRVCPPRTKRHAALYSLVKQIKYAASNRKRVSFKKRISLLADKSRQPEVRESAKETNQYLGELFLKTYESPVTAVPYESLPRVIEQDIKLIAFYFPQYHPFLENDTFWGRGFTEWTNTTKTVPLFKGHYQPRLPGELGFYDTRITDVLRRQIEIAKNYGVYGFCFHHYWFSGKPVMRVPYNQMLAHPDLDIPFCLHWANEPWTLRWDGYDHSGVLLGQKHTPQDDIEFIKDAMPALKDRRYIKINGRPLLIVYRPGLFPDIRSTVERWNSYCRTQGIGKLYLAYMQTDFDTGVDPRDYGFDAAIEYPPHKMALSNITQEINLFSKDFRGGIYDYPAMVQENSKRALPPYKLFRGVMPDWDNTARKKDSAIFVGSEPFQYRRWLMNQCESTRERFPAEERFVFANAWNEWAEGAYLEPDRKHGFAYLQSTYFGLKQYGLRVAVVAHLFHADLAEEFADYFKQVPAMFDLYISTGSDHRDKLDGIFSRHFGRDRVHVRAVENRGRDMAPFAVEFRDVYEQYDVVCWVHSKKSEYNEQLFGWRTYLLETLLGSPTAIDSILSRFQHDELLGVVYPEHYPPAAQSIEWGSNFLTAQRLLRKMSINIESSSAIEFPSGGMFWFRPKALAPLFGADLAVEDFEKKSEQKIDGTLAHAIERIILLVARHQGYGCEKILPAEKARRTKESARHTYGKSSHDSIGS